MTAVRKRQLIERLWHIHSYICRSEEDILASRYLIKKVMEMPLDIG